MSEGRFITLLDIDRDKAPIDPDIPGDIEEKMELYGDHLATLSDGLFGLGINTEIIAFPGELPSLMVIDDRYEGLRAGVKVDPVLITYESIAPIDDNSECYRLTVSIRLLFDSRFSKIVMRPADEWSSGGHITRLDTDGNGSVLLFITTVEYGGLSSPKAVSLMVENLWDEIGLFILAVKRSLGGK